MYYILKNLLLMSMVMLLLSACGKEKTPEERRISGQRQVSVRHTDVEELPESTPFAVYYDIRLEGKTVSMYEVTSSGTECVSTVVIDESYYPDEDISELKRGIKAYSKEGAYEILENFTN